MLWKNDQLKSLLGVAIIISILFGTIFLAYAGITTFKWLKRKKQEKTKEQNNNTTQLEYS